MSEPETQATTKVIIFLDTVGRTILGDLADGDYDDSIAVRNPVVVNIVPQAEGKMSVQLLPIFFREFLPDKTDDVIFYYKKKSVTLTNIETIDFRLLAQYNQMFSKSNLFVPPPSSQSSTNGGIVNLFDS